MSNEDHYKLIQTLKASRGKVIISGYESQMYKEELKGWKTARTNTYSQVCSKKQEILWMNFDPHEQLKQLEIEEFIKK